MKQQLLFTLAQEYPSFYLYEEATLTQRADRLLRDLPAAELLYSVKCNPAPAVLRTLFARGLGADAASLEEVKRSARLGLGPHEIYYSAPGKSQADLWAALPLSTVVADSLGELESIQAIAAQMGKTVSIGLRLNPDYSFGGGGGVPSKFGVDELQALEALAQEGRWPNVKVTGLHVHLRSQELCAPVLCEYYEALLALALRFQTLLGRSLDFLNLGSGLGIPYAPEDAELDTAGLGETLRALKAQLPRTRLLLETGRYVAGPSGVYVTRVMDKKVSQGKTFLILNATLNGFLRPSLAQLVNGYSSAPAPCEPLFTCPDPFRILALGGGTESETVTLVGSLYTAADVIAKDVTLPRLEVGDAVALTHAGSYGATLSPTLFSSQVPPAQLFLTRDGQVEDATL